MTRGRLIWPMLAEISPISTSGTEAAGNYDHRLREPVADTQGRTAPTYGTAYRLPCQVETEGDRHEQLRMMGAGDSPEMQLKLLFHFQTLEDEGRLDADGYATIRKGDRLDAIYTLDEVLVQRFTRIPIFVTEPQPRSHGLSSRLRNLLLVTFSSREKSTLSLP